MAMKPIVVIYHAQCSDGFGGAWAAWKKFGNKADYIPVYYHNPPPKELKNKEVYMIDFTYNAPVIKKLMKENKRVTSIDHHESQEGATKITEKYLYSVNNSGSVLAWKYFHPGVRVPKLLSHIEDGDLWRFKISHTKEVYAALSIKNKDFKTWDVLARDMENPAKRKKIIADGSLLLRGEEALVKYIAKNREVVELAGYRALAVNSPVFSSELGHLLDKDAPLAIIWSQRNSRVKVSLRSRGRVDVSKVAKKFEDGGGHRNAAGFSFRASDPLPWKLIVKNKAK